MGKYKRKIEAGGTEGWKEVGGRERRRNRNGKGRKMKMGKGKERKRE